MKQIHLRFWPEGKTKALTMSYDDGMVEDRKLVEIFNRYGIRGTFHLNSGTFQNGRHIDAGEVASLYDGHEVSVHTLTHPDLTNIPFTELVKEVCEDRKNLERLSGGIVNGMSYPYGRYNQKVVEALKNLGIVYSRTTASDDWFGLPKDFMTWHPTTHHKNRLMELCTSFLNMRNTIKWPALFYVWGHSYEFSNDNNWDLIEEFCKTVSGQPDVWYATNIDIYYYVTAMRALVFSCDNSLVYNPSAIDVWIGVDGQAVKVSAGSSVKL